MAGKIDTIKKAQQRLAPLIETAEARVGRLLLQAQSLPAEKSEVLNKILNRQSERLLEARNKLEKNNLNKLSEQRVNTYVAAKETPVLIQELKSVHKALTQIDDTLQRLLANAAKNQDQKTHTSHLQNRISPLIKAGEARVDALISQAREIPEQAQGFVKELNSKKRELSELSNELAKINIAQKNTPPDAVAKRTSIIIQKLQAIDSALKKIAEAIQGFFVKTAGNQIPSTSNVSNHQSQVEKSRSQAFADAPKMYTRPETLNFPEVPSRPVSRTPAAAQTLKSAEPHTRRAQQDYEKNQRLMQEAERLLSKKEPGVTRFYKQELSKLNKNLSKAEQALSRVEEAQRLLGSEPDSDEVDALLEAEFSKQFPKAPGKS